MDKYVSVQYGQPVLITKIYNTMDVIKTEIDGVVIIEPKIFGDARGYFFESFSQREFEEKVRKINFVQDNESMSSYGVMRGLHFQRPPFTQSKLVRCVKGTVLDVAVDIRKGSPTYGQHVAVELTEDNHRQFFVPRGFAHGFAVLSETAIFQYKCDNFYAPQADGGISIKDESFGIDWKIPTDKALLSEKKKQRDADKESLRFDSIAEAQSKSDALGKTVSEMKKAYDNAQSALSDSDKKIAGYNASITELSKQLSSDCVLDKEAETKKKVELSKKRTSDDDAAKVLHARIESNTKVLANIQVKVSDLDMLEKRYTWLKALSNTANGNISGKEKVMLETYIQMTYFDRIIARANTRFMIMSGGQYELKRRKEAENNRSQSGLDLDVIDHYNGTERSVKTLSGGESFKASLSLALGLSDEIQASAGGVKLDTMFVDEGFGSLDEESLDQAMKALSGLADGNRLVGIISHVVDLKNRIDKQIVVEKEKSGGSKANIVT